MSSFQQSLLWTKLKSNSGGGGSVTLSPLGASIKEVKTNNNGINIACKKQTEVRCVFKGKVKAIMPIPGMETFVLVKHGEYFTVYAKLVNVQVKIGQELNMGDIIATVYTAEAEQKTELHFEIFKGKQAQNPEVWLRN